MGDGPAEPRIGSGGGSPTPGGYPSGQRGLTVNQLADAFGGSNPSPPTGRKTYAPLAGGAQARQALIAQLVEHVLGKNGVIGSNPIVGSINRTDGMA